MSKLSIRWRTKILVSGAAAGTISTSFRTSSARLFVALDPNRHDRDWRDKKKLTEATFGWAITCHKAQGSQWENIVVWDDGLGRTEQDRRRWLYTAITRAERGLHDRSQ